MDIRKLADEANEAFPTNTDKAVRNFLGQMNKLADAVKKEMQRQLVIDGIKRNLDAARAAEKKHTVTSVASQPTTPSKPPVQPSFIGKPNSSRSSTTREAMNDTLMDTHYGSRENRMAIGDANRAVLGVWVQDAGTAAAGQLRNQDRFLAIQNKLKGDQIVRDQLSRIQLRDVWDSVEGEDRAAV